MYGLAKTHKCMFKSINGKKNNVKNPKDYGLVHPYDFIIQLYSALPGPYPVTAPHKSSIYNSWEPTSLLCQPNIHFIEFEFSVNIFKVDYHLIISKCHCVYSTIL